MTTPTTNFAWLKPDATEFADVDVLNTALDDMDVDIKAVSDANTGKIKPILKKRAVRGWNASHSMTLWTGTHLPDRWEDAWSVEGNVGGFTMDGAGEIKFTAAGVYRLGIDATS